MGLPYRLRDVDLAQDLAKEDPEFLTINPAGFIPALVDGDVTMVESIAILEYLLARYGPSPLVPAAADAAFPLYQQYLHLGEAGLAGAVYYVSGARNIAPADQRDNWSAGQALDVFETRLGLVTRQLERTPWLAGEAFTAADISVGYALEMARKNIGYAFGAVELAYMERFRARAGYKRTLEACWATRGWWTSPD
jgi:glutathione S-transferase